MGLNQAETWDLEKDMGARSPLLYMLHIDTNFGRATIKRCQGGAAGVYIVVGKAQGPRQAVYQVEGDGDINVDAGVQSGGWQMDHDSNDESEEADQVLDDEEFVREVPKRS